MRRELHGRPVTPGQGRIPLGEHRPHTCELVNQMLTSQTLISNTANSSQAHRYST